MTSRFLSHYRCELGEGPTYDRKIDTAFWFDIVGRKLFGHDFATGAELVTELPFMGSMAAMIDDESQIIAAENGFHIRSIESGKMVLHHPLEADNPDTRSNDGRAHPCGAIWIGTMGKKAEAGVGSIYHFHKGRLTRLYPDLTIPNAICFSPDGSTAYFADTVRNRLMRVTIDPTTALPTGEPEILHDHRGRKGGLDGAVVDTFGNLWIACWGASSILRLNGDGGVIDTITLPVTQPTCPCFVGANLDRLLVTSAWQGKPAPAGTTGDAGRTLIVDLPVRGKPEPRVEP